MTYKRGYMYRKIVRFLKKLKIAWSYAKLGYQEPEFDWSTSLKALDLAMFHLNHEIKTGYNANKKTLLKRVKIIRTLCKRLHSGDYEFEAGYEALEKKYGPSQISWEKADKGFSRMVELNQRRNDPKYIKDLKACFHKESYLKQQDLKLLGKYLERYLLHLWD